MELPLKALEQCVWFQDSVVCKNSVILLCSAFLVQTPGDVGGAEQRNREDGAAVFPRG